jgi:hypothetical protein
MHRATSHNWEAFNSFGTSSSSNHRHQHPNTSFTGIKRQPPEIVALLKPNSFFIAPIKNRKSKIKNSHALIPQLSSTLHSIARPEGLHE